jgi:hypothetical protein
MERRARKGVREAFFIIRNHNIFIQNILKQKNMNEKAVHTNTGKF